MANLSHDQCVQRMKHYMNKEEGLVVRFCRVNPLEWTQIHRNKDATIREGMIQKHAGILRRWSPRYFKLTREALSYSAEGTLRKRIPVEELHVPMSPSPKSSSGGLGGQFEIIAAGRELVLDASDEKSVNLWKHAINCAAWKAFEHDISQQGHQQNQHSAIPPQVQQQQQQMLQSYSQHPPPVMPTMSNGFGSSHATGHSHQKNPYWILQSCKLKVNADPSFTKSSVTSNVPDPRRIEFPNVEYNFELERKVLSAAKKD